MDSEFANPNKKMLRLLIEQAETVEIASGSDGSVMLLTKIDNTIENFGSNAGYQIRHFFEEDLCDYLDEEWENGRKRVLMFEDGASWPGFII